MSEKALHEIDAERVTELTVIDQSGEEVGVTNATLIGAERDDDELKVWVDTTIE